MNWLIFILLFVCFQAHAKSQDLSDLVPIRAILETKEDLVWNKWDTPNFIILSLDKSQGLQIKEDIENIFSKFTKKWGVELTQSKKQVKLICVPNEEYLFKLFNIKEPHCEVRYDSNGDVSLCAIWIDYNNFSKISEFLSQVFLCDGFSEHNYSFLVQKGISCLEKDVDAIKSNICNLEEINLNYLFDLNKQKWQSLNDKEKQKLEKQMCTVCLFLRREFGDRLFIKFLSKTQSSQSLFSTYGFKDNDQFVSIIRNYSKNLVEDISNNKTPDKYLKIK